ncbi:MAG: hypothetical protein ACFFDW_03205 [Candidatus Thorarchaeota archaeon]
MDTSQICQISIDSDSRFSKNQCPKCNMGGPIAGVINRPKLTKKEYEEIRLQSANYTSPFPDEKVPMYANLPHDCWGWNHFDAEVRKGAIYYEGKQVLTIKEISQFFVREEIYEKKEEENNEVKGFEKMHCICEESSILDKYEKYEYSYYYFYVYHGKFEFDEKTEGIPVLENTILYFNGHPMTDAHIMISIVEKIYE